jgi:hypothetical protein
MINGFSHKRVVVYVNNKRKLSIPVVGAAAYKKRSAAGGKNWIVAAHFYSKKPPYVGCETRLKSSPLPKLLYKVYGPNTFAACEAFRRKNCKATPR